MQSRTLNPRICRHPDLKSLNAYAHTEYLFGKVVGGVLTLRLHTIYIYFKAML